MLVVEADLVRDVPYVPLMLLRGAPPRCFLPAQLLLVLGNDAIRLRDTEDKCVAMILLDLLDCGTVEDDPITADVRDARPMHGSEARRSIPNLLEDLAPVAGCIPGEAERDGIEGATPGSIISWLSYMVRDDADDSDRFVDGGQRLVD